MEKYQDTALVRTHGVLRPYAGALVYVRDTATQALAVLYSDSGLTEKGNPTTTNEAGFYSFYVADGLYDITIAKAGFDPKVLTSVEIVDSTITTQAILLAEVQAEISAVRASIVTAQAFALDRGNHNGTDLASTTLMSNGTSVQARIEALESLLAGQPTGDPQITSDPAVPTGTLTVGSLLTAGAAGTVVNGVGGAPTRLRQWNRESPTSPRAAIPGQEMNSATAATYTLTAADRGMFISWSQQERDPTTGRLSNIRTSALTAVITGTVPVVSPVPEVTPSGTQPEGTELAMSSGTSSVANSTFGYRWKDNGVYMGPRSSDPILPGSLVLAGHTYTGDVIATSPLGVESVITAASNTVTISGTAVIAAATAPSLNAAEGGGSQTTIFITSGTAFAAPGDWPGTADSIECIGGGGAGRGASGSSTQGCGGGGGAYSLVLNVAVSDGATMQVGAGGATNGASGTDTWFNGANLAASSCGAKAGVGASTSAGGAGGATASGVGTTKYAGGAGGTTTTGSGSGGGGGGGAGGPNGTGAAGGGNSSGNQGAGGGGGNGGGTVGGTSASTTGGTGGNNSSGTGGGAGGAQNVSGSVGSSGGGGGGAGDYGTTNGAGGNGGAGIEWTTHGSGGGGGGAENAQPGNGGLYGAGGGGAGNDTSTYFGTGAQGLIVVKYTPVAGPTIYSGSSYVITPGTWTENGGAVTPSARRWGFVLQARTGFAENEYASNPSPAYLVNDYEGVAGRTKFPYPLADDTIRIREYATINGIEYASEASTSVVYTINPPLSTLAAQVVSASNTFTSGTTVSNVVPVTFTGGTTPIVRSINPSLPAALTFNASTGAIGGVANTVGTTTHRITGTDAVGATVYGDISVTIQSSANIPIVSRIRADLAFSAQPGTLQFGTSTPSIASQSEAGFTGGMSTTINGSNVRFGKFAVGGKQTIRHAIMNTDTQWFGGGVRRMDAVMGGSNSWVQNDVLWMAVRAYFPAAVYNSSSSRMLVMELHGATDGGFYCQLQRVNGASQAFVFQVIRNSLNSYDTHALGSFVSADTWTDFVVRLKLSTTAGTARSQIWINGVLRIDSPNANAASNTFPAYTKVAAYDGGSSGPAGGQWWHYTDSLTVKDNAEQYTEPQIRALLVG